jgi:hypothetical protein
MGRNAVSVLLLLAGSGAAWGYVRNATPSGTPLQWTGTNCIPVVINSAGSDDVTDGSAVQAVRAALSAWREATRHCSYIDFDVTERAGATADFSAKGPNETVIVWKESGWSHAKTAYGVTTVYFVDKPGDPRDGAIVDADIELNGEQYQFSTDGSQQRLDVQNIVTHYVGKLLGLGSTCYQGTGTRPKDHTGADVPDCGTVQGSTDPAHVALREATMWPFTTPGEISKRTLEADDIAGICAVYPVADDPGCHPAGGTDGGTDGRVDGPVPSGDAAGVSTRDGCGCHVGARPPRAWPGGSLVGLILLFLVRRGRRRYERERPSP